MPRSPFRDDVAAAHERSERLEAENRELRAEILAATRAARRPKAARAFAMLSGVVVGAVVSFVVMRPAPAPSSPAPAAEPLELRGVATASAAANGRASADTSRTKPLEAPRPACSCAAGDPLCSCL